MKNYNYEFEERKRLRVWVYRGVLSNRYRRRFISHSK